MCGIVAIVGKVDASAAQRAVAAMRHRGPDDEGVWFDSQRQLTLGHTRLAILDPSERGHQPMVARTGRCAVVFNGEIYNFQKLRDELERYGHTFHTGTDTEVLLAGYEEWGVEFVCRLRGMFAFALADLSVSGGRVLLARDRLGIKPLYFSQRDGIIYSASEVRALVRMGASDGVIDPLALADVLATGSVQEPRTIAHDVEAFPPGHFAVAEAGRLTFHKYWDLHRQTEGLRRELASIDEAGAVECLADVLKDAARGHVISDVPVGAFLSGGIDSTAVVGFMAEAMGRRVRTFSVGFDDRFSSDDERPSARLAAQHLGTDHTEVVVTGADALDSMPSAIEALDQPSADGFNTYLVSRAARPSVTVALSGLGGDEFFAGYGHHSLWVEAASRVPKGIPSIHRLLEMCEPAWRFLCNRNQRLRSVELCVSPPEHRMRVARHIPADRWVERMVGPFKPSVGGEWTFSTPPVPATADVLQRIVYSEWKTYLLNTLLRDTDAMSMAHAQEVRPLLLDHHVVELAYALPVRFKLGSDGGKRVLRLVARKFRPEHLEHLPKRGFSLPYAGWMRSELRPFVRRALRSKVARRVFAPAYRLTRLAELAAGRASAATWRAAMLSAWVDQSDLSLPEAP